MPEPMLAPAPAREPWQAAYADEHNPVGLDGIEFIEFATSRPQALGQVLEMMGFRPVARHRSREVMLYRQGDLNLVVNAHPADGKTDTGADAAPPSLSALALRVRDARAAHRSVLERGGWDVPSHPEAMELNIPAIHGVGGSRLYFVDRYDEFSIYDIDFVPIPSVEQRPPVRVPGLHMFGIVQYIGSGRSADWVAFYQALFGLQPIPQDQRFGILPRGTLLRAPAVNPAHGFLLQLVEPESTAGGTAGDEAEGLQRIGLGVPDVPAAVRTLRALGMDFVESAAAHTEARGALTKTYLGSVAFELVHSPAQEACA